MSETEKVTAADAFLVEIDGIANAGFATVRGLGAERAVFAYREGGAGRTTWLVGDIDWAPIVLERGVALDGSLRDWFERGDPRAGAIVLVDRAAREVVRWSFDRAWPVRWDGPTLDASAAGVAVERLEIVHEGLTCR